MSLLDDTKRAFRGMLHPSLNTEEMSTGAALKFYYRAAVIPFVISAILGVIVSYILLSIATSSSYSLTTMGKATIQSSLLALVVVGYLVDVFIFTPIGIVVFSAILQFFSKTLFKFWQGGYNRTLTASVFSIFPSIFFLWLTQLPYVEFVIAIWVAVVMIITLAKQHQISTKMAFVGWLVPSILVGIIVGLVVALPFWLGLYNSSSLVSNLCIPQAGFLCSNLTVAPSKLTISLGQTAGQWSNVTFCLVNSNVTLTPQSCPGIESAKISTLKLDQVVNVAFTDSTGKIIPYSKGKQFTAYVWALYTSNGTPEATKIGTIYGTS